MSNTQANSGSSRIPRLDRRELLAMSTTFGASFLATQGLMSRPMPLKRTRRSVKRPNPPANATT